MIHEDNNNNEKHGRSIHTELDEVLRGFWWLIVIFLSTTHLSRKGTLGVQ
jgi:hypothetical protein